MFFKITILLDELISRYNIFQTVNITRMINFYQLFNIHCGHNEKDTFIHTYGQYVTLSDKHRIPSSLLKNRPAMQKVWGSNLVEGRGVFFLFSFVRQFD